MQNMPHALTHLSYIYIYIHTDQFWDATLSRVPRRKESLLFLKRAGLLQHTAPRHVVLDRETQHLQICPDSQAVVRNCRILRNTGLAAVASWTAFLWQQWRLQQQRRHLFWIPLLGSAVAWAAEQVRRQFYYVYTEKRRDRDLQKIPTKTWSDPN